MTQARDSVDQTTRELSAIFDTDAIGIAIVVDDTIVRCNRRLEDILAASPGTLSDQSTRQFFETDTEYARALIAVQSAFAEGGVYHSEQQARRADGQKVWLRISSSMLNADRVQDGAVWLLQDMSAEHAMEDTVRRSLDEQRTIFDNAGVGIMHVHKRTITRCNERLAQLLGYQVHELLGGSTRLFYESEEQYKQLGRDGYEVLLQGRAFDIEMPMRHRNGQEIWVRATGSLVAGAPVDSGDVIWIMEDITARKQDQLALHRAHDELAATLEHLRATQAELVLAEKLAALGSLVAGVAHELNTPVGNALTAASTLQQRSQEMRTAIAGGKLQRSQLDGFMGDLTDIAELVTRSCSRAAQLISGFKQLAVGRTAERRGTSALLPLVQEVVASQKVKPAGAAWGVHYDIAPELVYEGYLHPFIQVVGALVENAHTHAFVGRDQGALHIAATLEDGWFELRFVDDGVGMDARTMALIFDPFFTTRRGQGRSGLGLAIARNLATVVLGGEIEVQSQLGVGSTFSLRFPAIAPPPADA